MSKRHWNKRVNEMKKKIEEELWEKGQYVHEYPKDWIVIPVREVIEIIEESEGK